MAKRTKQERIEAIEEALQVSWRRVHRRLDRNVPLDGDFFGYSNEGAGLFAMFVEEVLQLSGISEFKACDIAHFDAPDTLALWIVEAQDRRERLAKETP